MSHALSLPEDMQDRQQRKGILVSTDWPHGLPGCFHPLIVYVWPLDVSSVGYKPNSRLQGDRPPDDVRTRSWSTAHGHHAQSRLYGDDLRTLS